MAASFDSSSHNDKHFASERPADNTHSGIEGHSRLSDQLRCLAQVLSVLNAFEAPILKMLFGVLQVHVCHLTRASLETQERHTAMSITPTHTFAHSHGHRLLPTRSGNFLGRGH